MVLLIWLVSDEERKQLYNVEDWGQCYKTCYRGNLLPFHGNTVNLYYKAILPWKLLWNDSKLPWYM
jgi:hypothetical protein